MAIAVQADIAIAWPSTVVSIPTGWQRVTELDSVYVVGAAAGANTDLITARGNATHLHTSPAHTPTQNAHTGTGLSSTPTGTIAASGTGTQTASTAHTHAITLSSVVAENNASTITIDPVNNDLLHTKVIWIKSLGTPASFPVGSIIFWDTDSLPAGWSRTTLDYYLKGAVAADNGGSTAGANTHTHTSPPHTHTQNSHNHTTPQTSGNPDVSVAKGTTGVTVTTITHKHGVTITAKTAINDPVTTTLPTPKNHEPPYKYINALNSAVPDYPVGAIAIWLGTNTAIPTGWTRVTDLDTFWPKCTAGAGTVLTTGGTTQHLHTAVDCQPTQPIHTHTMANASITGTRTAPGTGTNVSSGTHTHTWTDDEATAATNQASAVLIDNCAVGAAYPLYRTVIFVKLVTPQDGTPSVVGPVWTTQWRTGYREDMHTQDLTRAAYRERRRGEG